MAELLPSVDVVVMDEAHQINETGLQFLGEVLSTGALVDLAQDLLATGIQHARGQQAWADLAGSLDHAARDLRLLGGRQNGKRAWPAASPVGIAADEWQEALDQLGVALTEAQEALAAVDAQAPELTRMRERLCEQAGRVMLFQKPRPVDRVRWLDVTAGMRLVESPLDIAPFLRAQTQAAEGEGARKAWVFTSATLGEDADLKWFKESCGLEHAQVLKVASPFDYAHQAAYFVPRDFPETSQTDAHMQAVAQLAGQVALRLGGRTLVLTTTLRALQTITDQLTDALIDTDIRVLAQGSQPKRALMDAFREAGAKEGGAVLVGSASFWEGVDVPGAALQAVIIDKLPFPPPNDPLVEARSQRLQQQGLNSFAHLHLPEAAVALKQGAGRLIRHEEDLGVLVICDRRLAVSTYGARLRQALPPMRALTSRQELMDQLDLTKNATKISVQI
jgi:ATP-dependent DNA helicase DinG